MEADADDFKCLFDEPLEKDGDESFNHLPPPSSLLTTNYAFFLSSSCSSSSYSLETMMILKKSLDQTLWRVNTLSQMAGL